MLQHPTQRRVGLSSAEVVGEERKDLEPRIASRVEGPTDPGEGGVIDGSVPVTLERVVDPYQRLVRLVSGREVRLVRIEDGVPLGAAIGVREILVRFREP